MSLDTTKIFLQFGLFSLSKPRHFFLGELFKGAVHFHLLNFLEAHAEIS